MRARGAKVTDIAVLVVAADDGVMPQTKESISHARAAEVPIVVAVNKMDMPDANVDRVKSELAAEGLQPEDWGGTTQFSAVSAREKENLDDLLEKILLVADAELDLRANPEADASGVVIESRLDVGRGPVSTVLVHRGTLRVGDAVVAGDASGKVRALYDYRGEKVKRGADRASRSRCSASITRLLRASSCASSSTSARRSTSRTCARSDSGASSSPSVRDVACRSRRCTTISRRARSRT